jgi:hypothetical protein
VQTEEYDEQLVFDFYNDDEFSKQKLPYDVHARWDWVMNEMIWAFEQLNSDWESQFHKGQIDLESVVCEWDENEKPKLFQLVNGPNYTAEYDIEGAQAHSKRIDNGLRLFGKYFRNLWD